MNKFTLAKGERLKSKKVIASLFKEGHSFLAFPLRLVWIQLDTPADLPYPVQIALTVPKRSFGNAVDRNLLKRRMREAYRLNKPYLYQQLQHNSNQYAFMLIYIAKETLPYKTIDKGAQKIIKRFLAHLDSNQ